MAGRHVFIAGGANSAGQAAVNLARYASQVTSSYLPGAIQRDRRGSVLTGSDIHDAAWPLRRAPQPLETSLPGVFSAGDVRSGSVKRVAAAAGEGSVAATQVIRLVTELRDANSMG